jgi:hypothetical protein
MIWRVKSVSDFDRIASNVAIWHGYDSAVKAELYSTCLLSSDGANLVDPFLCTGKHFMIFSVPAVLRELS